MKYSPAWPPGRRASFSFSWASRCTTSGQGMSARANGEIENEHPIRSRITARVEAANRSFELRCATSAFCPDLPSSAASHLPLSEREEKSRGRQCLLPPLPGAEDSGEGTPILFTRRRNPRPVHRAKSGSAACRARIRKAVASTRMTPGIIFECSE